MLVLHAAEHTQSELLAQLVLLLLLLLLDDLWVSTHELHLAVAATGGTRLTLVGEFWHHPRHLLRRVLLLLLLHFLECLLLIEHLDVVHVSYQLMARVVLDTPVLISFIHFKVLIDVVRHGVLLLVLGELIIYLRFNLTVMVVLEVIIVVREPQALAALRPRE